ncbi:MAG: WG repeat-containing protein, partial [Bacteroidota bacterium]
MRYLISLALTFFCFHSLLAQDYFPVKVSRKWGLMNQQGALFLPPVYDAIGEFKKYGYAVMQQNGGAGVIHQSGQVVVAPQ